MHWRPKDSTDRVTVSHDKPVVLDGVDHYAVAYRDSGGEWVLQHIRAVQAFTNGDVVSTLRAPERFDDEAHALFWEALAPEIEAADMPTDQPDRWTRLSEHEFAMNVPGGVVLLHATQCASSMVFIPNAGVPHLKNPKEFNLG
jgi:hypothetical protein